MTDTKHTASSTPTRESAPAAEPKAEKKDAKDHLLDALVDALDAVANGTPGNRILKMNYVRAALEKGFQAYDDARKKH